MPGGMRTYTGTLAAAQDTVVVPCDGLEGIVFTTAAGLTGVVLFEASLDGTTFLNVPAYGSTGGFQTSGFSNPGSQLFFVAAGPGVKAVRIRCSSFTSGSTAVMGAADASQAPSAFAVLQLNNAVQSGAGIASTSQTGALTKHRLLSAASTNATNVKAAAANVHVIHVANDGGTKAFMKIYDKATAPNPAADTPIRTILLPPGSQQHFEFDSIQRLNCGTGLGYVLVGLIADTDTTAVGAAQIALDIQYI